MNDLERQIWDVERFEVVITTAEGHDLSLTVRYPYERGANQAWTCAQWRKKRFLEHYPGLKVDVLEPDGSEIHGLTRLATIRERWSSAPAAFSQAPLVARNAKPSVHTAPKVGAEFVTSPRSTGLPQPAQSRSMVETGTAKWRKLPLWAKVALPATVGLVGLSAASGNVGNESNAAPTTLTSQATTGRAAIEETIRTTTTVATTQPSTTTTAFSTTQAPTTTTTTTTTTIAPATTTTIAPATTTTTLPTTTPPTIPFIAPLAQPIEPSGVDPHFGTCREAKANGYGPYRQGRDAEYDWYTDRDNDGIVCE